MIRFTDLPDGDRRDWLSLPATRAFLSAIVDHQDGVTDEILRLAVGGSIDELRFRAGIHEGLGRVLRLTEGR